MGELAEGVSKSLGIAWRDKQAGNAVLDDLWDSTDARCDSWTTEGACLSGDKPEGFYT